MRRDKIKTIFSKIGIRLVIPYLVISFIILILISALILYNFRVQINSIQEIQEEISLKASSEINLYIEGIIQELELFGKEIGKTNSFEKELSIKSLRNLIDHNPSIYSLSIVDIKGKEIIKIVRYDPKASSELKNISAQDKFKKALGGDYYLGTVYISKYQIPFISISVPIIDENNTIIGVLASEVDLSPMWGTISKIYVKKTGYVYVVDQDGKLIAYKDVSSVKKNLDLSHFKGVQNFLGNIRQPERYNSFNNEEVIGNWKLIDVSGWGVVVEIPIKEVYQELLPLFILAVVALLFFITFMIVILLIIFRTVLTPLDILQKGVIEVEEGNLDYKIGIKSKDEFGDLASVFNRMTDDLKSSREKIERHQHELEDAVKKRTEELKIKVKEGEDRKTATLNILEDVEESRKKLMQTQEELKKYVKELKIMDKKKDEFISITAHELKTPLTSIRGFSDLLQKPLIANNLEKRNHYLKIIGEDTERLGKLITDILDLTRLDLGTMKFNYKKVNVKELIENLKRQMDIMIKNKKINSEYNVDENLHNFDIDESRMIQILSNFITNAIKYTSKNGKIIVSAMKEGNNIKFSVADTGVGIPQEEHDKIFDRFYQIDSSYTRKVGGSGLGLAICKEMTQAMNGKLELESEVGKGTRFSVIFPIERTQEKRS